MAYAAAHALSGDDSICRASYDTRAGICAFDFVVVMTKQFMVLSVQHLRASLTWRREREACLAECAAVQQTEYDRLLQLILSLLRSLVCISGQ